MRTKVEATLPQVRAPAGVALDILPLLRNQSRGHTYAKYAGDAWNASYARDAWRARHSHERPKILIKSLRDVLCPRSRTWGIVHPLETLFSHTNIVQTNRQAASLFSLTDKCAIIL